MQILGLSLLIMLIALLASISAITKETIIGGSDRLKIESKQNDFIFSINPDNRLKQPVDEELPENQTLIQQYYVNQLSQKEKYDFSWSRTEGRVFSNVTNDGEKIKIKALAKTNISSEDVDFTNEINVDSLVISKGKNFSTDVIEAKKEIIINENFAKENSLKIGDIVRVQLDKQGDTLNVRDNPEVKKDLEGVVNINTDLPEQYKKYYWMQIVGFGTSADFTSPIIDETSVIPNAKTNMVAYVHPSHFGMVVDGDSPFYLQSVTESSLMPTSSYGSEVYYSAKFNSIKYDLKTIDNEFKKVTGNNAGNQKVVYGYNDGDYIFSQRTMLLDQVVIAYKVVIITLLVVVAGISLFALIIMLRKQVEIFRTQLGILKALGVKKLEIVNNFVAVPMISGAIGVTIGYVVSILISPLIMDVFSSFFSVSFVMSSFNVISLVNSIFTTWFALLAITFLCAYLTIKETPSRLLTKMNSNSIGFIQMKIKSIGSRRKKFEPRLRVAVLSTSWQKYLGTLLTIIVSTFILSITVITPKILDSNKDKAFDGLNYQNKVEYNDPISSNPLSFYKTYNPDKNNKMEGWGFPIPNNADAKLLDISMGGVSTEKNGVSPKTQAYTSNAVTTDELGKVIFDTNKIYEQFITGDISNFYYNHDIPLESTTAWARLGFSDWTTFSTGFFKALDSLPNIKTPSGIIGGIAMQALLTQWTDYTNLKRNLSNVIKDTELTKKPTREQYILFNKYMLEFYQTYIVGPPLTVNQEFLINENNFVDVKKVDEKINRSHFLSKGKNILFSEPKSVDDLKIVKKDNGHDLELVINDEIIDLIDLSNSELQDEKKWTVDKIMDLNRHLVTWFISMVDNRIGVAILETGYSRAPYFVQEYMKDAINNNKDYGLGFNIVPFNPNTDTRGTMFDAFYQNSLIKVNGIDKNNSLVEFDKNKDELFKVEPKDEYIPIIINESVSKKFNINKNSLIELDIKNDTLESKNNEDEDFETLKPGDVKVGAMNRGGAPMYESEFRSNSAKSVQSTDGKNFADASILSLSPVKIGGSEITSRTSRTSTEQTAIHKKFSDGNLKIGFENVTKKFEVVGIQKSYGQLQAWISNDNANKAIGYDKTQSQMFGSWFVPETAKNKDYKKWLVSKGYSENDVDDVLNSLIKIIETKEYENNLTQYQVFKSQMNGSNNETKEIYEIIDASFNNSFPIFNYKYSSDSEVKDMTRGLSTSQRFSDFSAQGMNGNYVINPITGEPDFDKFVEGYGVSTFKTMAPIYESKQILAQITDIVNIIVIGLITLAVLVSMIIILLVTILVINDNKEFLATMKLLGYSNYYVLRQILTPYIIGVVIVFIVGFSASWFFFVWGVGLVATNTRFVLPIGFEFWMPLMVFAILFLIYSSTMIVTYNQIRKIKPSALLS
ncbi:ABC transporter permease [Spiroplasma endosymbiont of Othius punctulatus]|uniref:ABC transporter permease n=1 Tax=Spiroplasma endosymbiont of Othius punctulatus TaxID=3066289 RepID=UPI0030D085B1